jgi:hypothetical protein
MKTNRNGLLAMAAFLLLAGASLAQEPGAPGKKQQGSGMGMQHGQAMSMDGKMQNCQKNMQSMMQSNERLKKTIEAAKTSGDPAKMRSALDDAEKYVNSTNDHMKACMSTMTMMHNMHGSGMMGGQMQGMDQGSMMNDKKNGTANPAPK